MKGWNKSLFASFLLVAAVALGVPATPVDQNPPSTAQLEIRANQAFNRGEYNTALPILKKLSSTFADEPGRLGPLQEKIRVCEKALAALKMAGPTTLPSADAASAEARKPHPAPKSGVVQEMAIKELGNFEYDQEHGGNIPADVKALSNSTVRLRGFMIPMDQAENITQFALVPSLFACCFGQPPQIQHTIVVNCPKGKAVGYCPDEIVVEGNLKVGEKKDDGYIVSIFELDVHSVKPAPK
ncbi:MAG TPA: DUF3299 domain-containing protein [Tepidisphaeraceae bacterium]|jgi:hypothetical protein|nr:DUF3299 domain-containing protein [Tepidisphaeraceae bacterium]